MMEQKSVIIIGAGLAGLSAGCYGQMNGYTTRIFEQHTLAGGLCTGWKRKGYTINTSGWVTGTSPEDKNFYPMWCELGVEQDWSILYYEEYTRIIGDDGQTFILYTDIDRLEQHMIELAPEDEKTIRGFIRVLHIMAGFSMPMQKAPELFSVKEKTQMVGGMLSLMFGPAGKWMNMTVQDFGKKFTNPFLREAVTKGLPNAFFFDQDIPLMMILMTLASMHTKTAGYPMGGSLSFIQSIENLYRKLGGDIRYKSRVEKILVKNNRAVGVRLADGTEHFADHIVCASDGHTALYNMLEGHYTPKKLTRNYETLPHYQPILFVSIGVNRQFDKMPSSVAGEIFPLDKPIRIDDVVCEQLAPHLYDFDASLAPEGKTLIRVMLPTTWEYWNRLRTTDQEAYKSAKQDVAEQVIHALDSRYAGIAKEVDMVDVSTPVTFERYTGNWKGAWMGWRYSLKTMRMRFSKTLPGLKNFYQIGTWILNGSIAMAANSGRHVIQILCNRDSQLFKSSIS